MLMALMVAAVPPMVTAVAPVKLVPVITKDDPTHPLAAPKLVIVGGKVCVTQIVKAFAVKSPLES